MECRRSCKYDTLSVPLSNNDQCRRDLKQFVEHTQYGVVLCVRMLFYGFNDLNIGTVIIAQNKTDANNLKHINAIKQMLGRACRIKGEKIAYILTFNDIKQNIIDPLLAKINHTYAAAEDYLGASNVYYFDKGRQQWQVIDAEEKEDDLTVDFHIEAYNDYSKRRDFSSAEETRKSEGENHTEDEDVQTTWTPPIVFSQQVKNNLQQASSDSLLNKRKTAHVSSVKVGN